MNIKRLAFLTIMLTYLLIVFGGYVASSHSGLGCGPEWPKCNGEIVPVLKGATLIEYLHRLIGALLGFLSLWLFFKILRAKSGDKVPLVAFAMLSLLVVQILFGAAVVLRDLPALVITLHLLIAMIFLALLIWLWRSPHLEGENPFVSDKHQRAAVLHLNILLGLILVTLAFAGYIKHESYDLACGWLGCRHSFFPSTTPEILQTLHRGFAAASALYTVILTCVAFIKRWNAAIRRRLLLCSATVLLQMVVGILVIMKNIDLPWAVLHLAIGTALFAFVSEARIYLGNLSVKIKSVVHLKGTWQDRGNELE